MRFRLHRGSVFSSRTRGERESGQRLMKCWLLRILSVMMMSPFVIMLDDSGNQISLPIVMMTYLSCQWLMGFFDAFFFRMPHLMISAPSSKRTGVASLSTRGETRPAVTQHIQHFQRAIAEQIALIAKEHRRLDIRVRRVTQREIHITQLASRLTSLFHQSESKSALGSCDKTRARSISAPTED